MNKEPATYSFQLLELLSEEKIKEINSHNEDGWRWEWMLANVEGFDTTIVKLTRRKEYYFRHWNAEGITKPMTLADKADFCKTFNLKGFEDSERAQIVEIFVFEYVRVENANHLKIAQGECHVEDFEYNGEYPVILRINNSDWGDWCTPIGEAEFRQLLDKVEDQLKTARETILT